MAFDAAAGNGGDNTPDISGGGDNGFNPAWNPIMEKLPSEFHNMIAPTLKEWDSNFQKVQTAYSPYKQFAEAEIAPEHINASLQLAQVLQTNPRLVYDKMVEAYGDEWGLNQQVQGPEIDDESDDAFIGENDFNPESHPMFQQMQQQMGAIAQFQQAQIEQQERQRIDAEINRDFEAISTQYGELSQQDIQMIAAVSLQNEISLPKAAEQVMAYRGAQAQQKQNPANTLPNVVPPGGGMPSQAIDPTKMNGAQTRNMVAQMMQQMMGQGN